MAFQHVLVKAGFDLIMMVWTCGNAIIIYLAGLQDIPDSLYESAALDGAGFFRQTMSVTIPLLRSTILYNVVTLIIAVFQWFAEPYIMTSGGWTIRPCSIPCICIRTRSLTLRWDMHPQWPGSCC